MEVCLGLQVSVLHVRWSNLGNRLLHLWLVGEAITHTDEFPEEGVTFLTLVHRGVHDGQSHQNFGTFNQLHSWMISILAQMQKSIEHDVSWLHNVTVLLVVCQD